MCELTWQKSADKVGALIDDTYLSHYDNQFSKTGSINQTCGNVKASKPIHKQINMKTASHENFHEVNITGKVATSNGEEFEHEAEVGIV